LESLAQFRFGVHHDRPIPGDRFIERKAGGQQEPHRIALGGVVLFYRSPETYQMLGITYLGIAIVRLVSMFIDDSVERSNIISLVVEVVFGIILVLPL
jgi:hypothetical protein